ncbi:MAG: hypothetical protein JNK58_01735 [Phycisphaerae bacterium]|nr:hypothetical protein [Phycisphaerae bacterium]
MNRRTILFLSIVAALPFTSASAQVAEPAISPTRMLEAAVRDTNSPTGHIAFDGLRNLRDPSLRPLFSWLSTARSPGQRRQGVLGLAELETPPRINPLLLSRIPDRAEQAALLGEGLALDLIGTDQIEQMLAWPDLEPYIEVALRARLQREGKALDRARVESLAEKGGLSTELLAAAVLAQAGEPGRLDQAAGKLLALSDPARGAIIGPLLESVRRERLSKASPLIGRLHAVYTSYPSLAADILRTWIRLAPEDGLPVLYQAWDKAAGLPEQLRLALIALDASDLADPSLFDRIATASDNEVLSAMGRLGGVLARKEPAIPALHDLIKLRYLAVELWIMDRAKTWDAETSAEACRAMINAWAARPSTPDPISDAVLPAAKGLVEADREFLASALVKACERTDDRIALAITMALLAKNSPPVWDVNHPPRWPDNQSEAVGLLVYAQSVEPSKFPAGWTPALEGIATGVGTRLSPPMRAQAAWLLVKIRDQEEQTLARLLAGG